MSVAPDLTEADLALTARVELALRGMIADHRLDALTYQFMAFGDDERTPTLPFVAASRLMAEGIGFGGEGDLIAAAATTFFNWLQPPASFTEIFTIDFAGDSLFLSHMGEANTAMARRDRKIPLVARPAPITRTRGRPIGPGHQLRAWAGHHRRPDSRSARQVAAYRRRGGAGGLWPAAGLLRAAFQA